MRFFCRPWKFCVDLRVEMDKTHSFCIKHPMLRALLLFIVSDLVIADCAKLLSARVAQSIGQVREFARLRELAENGHTGALEKLLSAGADVKVKDYGGNVALMYAKRGGHSEIIAILEKL